LIVVFGPTAAARGTTYERGEVIDISPNYIDSPAPLSGSPFPPPQILVGHSLRIRVGGMEYFVYAAIYGPLRSKYKPEWAVHDPIEFRFDKGKMYVRRRNGKELQAKLIKVAPANDNARTVPAPPSAPSPQFRPFVEPPPRDKVLPLGIDFLRADDVCLILTGDVEAGDFFNGLRFHKRSNRDEFRRHGQRVDNFPNILTVKVIAELGTCTPRERAAEPGNVASRNVRLDEDFMKSVAFEGSWKHGFDETPADLGPMAEGRIPNPMPSLSYRDWWEYEFQVRSSGVSLNNALIIMVQSPDGRMVARLSARLPMP
jgi:hypothetical protein